MLLPDLKRRPNPRFESAHFIKSLLRSCRLRCPCPWYVDCHTLEPHIIPLTFGKTTFSNPNYSFKSKFDLLDLVTKLFTGSYDTVRPEVLPFVYCGTITLILLPLSS